MPLIFEKKFITLSDLYLAYRKAKTDAFFDNFHPCKRRYAEFESGLHDNLLSLHKKLIYDNNSNPWHKDDSFLGGYSYAPKSIDATPWEDKEYVHFRSIDQNEDWLNKYKENGNKRLPVSYRLIINATVEYQIISALWILKVGHKFESLLDKNLSYGNRLRRKSHPFEDLGPFNGELNLDSLGLFSPYFSAYRTWRQKGLDAMRDIVQNNKNATAITMDLASFYHKTSPNFILRPSFLSKTGIQLDKDERKFTQQLIDSIHCWYKGTPDFSERSNGALPVGLSASKIISNVLLYELDREISHNINPEYYGRYVDDIFLVFETPPNLSNGNDVIEYLSKNVDCLRVNRTRGEAPTISLKLNYASDCELKFTPSKQKIFSLSPKYGLDLVNQISSQIRAQSSEYRMLPALPEDANSMAEKALLASSDASLITDALRKADVVSIRRLGLALLIRDLENYSSDLSRLEWAHIRKEFYGLVERYIITPKGIFDLSSYLSRIFQIMISSYDFIDSRSLIDKLIHCFNIIDKTTDSSARRKLSLCKKYFSESLVEVALRASTINNFDKWHELRKTVIHICNLYEHEYKSITKNKLKEISRSLLISDLGVRSYKDYWFYNQEHDESTIKIPKHLSVNKILNLPLIRKFRTEALLKLPHWPALAFPTRPLSIPEIVMTCPKTLDDSQLLKDFIFGLRGAKTIENIDFYRASDSNGGSKIFIPNETPDIVSIALTNFETTNEQFNLAINNNPDLRLKRYVKLNSLINDILKSDHRTDYIVFPECSLPRKWAINIAMKLAKRKISLIGGIEYHKPTAKNEIRNDCLLSLTTRWPGYNSSFIFFQPKLHPAHTEESQLKKKSLKLFQPEQKEKLPIYIHGNYCLGVLICSDLTSPMNRVRFQGKVDSLFVLEWNPDVKTFSSLVEGSAHDIHTFIIQVNNRAYGDSRVRAPYRIDYKRDLVRIKGGLVDYFVIAEIDYKSLRKFQRKGKMTDPYSEFKPTPIGFSISPHRG